MPEELQLHMEKHLVSIGIPAYNKPDGLRRTLECITSQTYSNLEIIISNDGSPNIITEAVALEYSRSDPRIKYYRHDINRGGFFNFGFVLTKATGKYFMWAADDDEWDTTYIEKCVNVMKESPNLGLVFTRYTVTSNIDKKNIRLNHNIYLKSKYKRPIFLLLDECITHKANMLYGLWKNEIAARIFEEAIRRGLEQKHMGHGFDNAFLTLTLELTNVYQIQEVLFNKRYIDRIIPGSYRSLLRAFLTNLEKFLRNPIRYIIKSLVESREYSYTIKDIIDKPKDRRWLGILIIKQFLYILFRRIL